MQCPSCRLQAAIANRCEIYRYSSSSSSSISIGRGRRCQTSFISMSNVLKMWTWKFSKSKSCPSFHPSTVACWSCPDASTPSRRRRRRRRFAKFLFDSKHLHKTQSILLRSFRLPVQLNPIWFAIRFVIFEKKKIIHSIYVCMPILKYKIFEKEGEREGTQKEAKLFTSKWRAWNLWGKCCRCVPYCTWSI